MVGGRYELLEVIGEGGMGTVFKARHTLSEHFVALKLLRDGSAGAGLALERFKREASASARIGHPGLVQVLDAGSVGQDGGLFIAMELLEGETLKARLAAADISTREKLEWLLKLLDPLEALHAAGFVHRDLKPENVFIARRADGTEQVKLLDFGLARQIGVDTATATGVGFGTPHYMAPEQSVSAKEVTSAADVWAAGVILYEMLAGTKPFTGETPNAIIVAACTADQQPLVDPALSRELVSLVDACLEKRPEDRLQTAGALRSALEYALRDLPPAPKRVATLGQRTSGAPPPASMDAAGPLCTTLLNADTLDVPPSNPPPSAGLELNTAVSPPATEAEPQRSNSTRWAALALAGFLGGGALLWSATSQDHEATQQAVSARGAPSLAPAASLGAAPSAQISAQLGGAAAEPPLPPASQTPRPSGVAPRPTALPAPSAARRTPPPPSAAPDDDPGYLEVWKGQ